MFFACFLKEPHHQSERNENNILFEEGKGQKQSENSKPSKFVLLTIQIPPPPPFLILPCYFVSPSSKMSGKTLPTNFCLDNLGMKIVILLRSDGGTLRFQVATFKTSQKAKTHQNQTHTQTKKNQKTNSTTNLREFPKGYLVIKLQQLLGHKRSKFFAGFVILCACLTG